MCLFPFLRVIFIFIFIFITGCQSESNNYSLCPPSSCGNIKNISFPFRLKSDPINCGNPDYELDCQNNQTIVTFIYNYDGEYSSMKYLVQSICYNNFTIRVVDPALINTTTNSYSFPVINNIPIQVFMDFQSAYSLSSNSISRIFYIQILTNHNYNLPIVFISCEEEPISYSSSSSYIDISFCRGRNTTGLWNPLRTYGYIGVLMNENTTISDLPETCGVEEVALVSVNGPLSESHNSCLVDIHQGLAYGFELSWFTALCGNCFDNGGTCSIEANKSEVSCGAYNSCPGVSSLVQVELGLRTIHIQSIRSRSKLFYSGISRDNPPTFFCYFSFWVEGTGELVIIAIGGLLVIRFFIGLVCLIVLVVHKWRKRHLSGDETIEDFLQGQTNILPIKYSYSDIKKMTNKFNHKLGEGGYGIVYKGKLRSGPLVAVKMTNKSISSTREFSNEVGTIGRIHHVNVVQLIGFCNEGSKHALVYEYMPNGSLDKYISPAPGLVALTYKNMFDISLGVARGIDYLHKGCDMQILHFDIKPHNILLDEDFKPKVSDFGLAKLYPTDVNTVTLPTTTARGTTGYMAPELFYKNIGGVSYKADVYSFGMLLMELASRKENINPFAEDDGQIYFPSWVYDQLNDGKEIDMRNVSDEERMMVKKMIKVALWCIQMKPGTRPSMNKVVEMLEGDDELLHMPPRPFIAPHGISDHENGISAKTTET